MAETQGRASLFRKRSPGSHPPVTFLELFFDLVFVFAVTQLSHDLRAHFGATILLETAMLMLAVWWASGSSNTRCGAAGSSRTWRAWPC
jgi:low temperature requirement protein LtrA